MGILYTCNCKTSSVNWNGPQVSMLHKWRHNGCDGVSNHQPRDCLLSRLIRRRSKKTSKLRVTGLYAGNSPVTGEFPAQMASNAEYGSIWWRHHDVFVVSRDDADCLCKSDCKGMPRQLHVPNGFAYYYYMKHETSTRCRASRSVKQSKGPCLRGSLGYHEHIFQGVYELLTPNLVKNTLWSSMKTDEGITQIWVPFTNMD